MKGSKQERETELADLTARLETLTKNEVCVACIIARNINATHIIYHRLS